MGAQWSSLLRNRIAALIVIEVAFIAMTTALNPDFLRPQNFVVLLDNMAYPAIVAAFTVAILAAGRFDLSIGGVAALSAIVTGKMMTDGGLPVWLSVAAGFGTGLVIGFTNGYLIERFNLNPLMTTLATWWFAQGAALGITQSLSPSSFPETFTAVGQARLFGLAMPVWIALVLCIIVGIVLTRTKFGYHVFATGGDRAAARLNGVKVRRVGILVYVGSALAASLAGLLFASRLDSAPAQAFTGMALTVIAAVVIGGASLEGGSGSVVGALLGLFLLQLFGNASIYVGISPYWQQSISGVILLVAIIADQFAYNRRTTSGVKLRMPANLQSKA